MSLPRTYSELGQHIEVKERELQEIRELRIVQLETLLEERDQLLLESSKRFEKLKDDFEYNLTLIEARDVEIERLEHELRVSNGECEQYHSEIKGLSQQLDAAQTREHDAQKKLELDRINHKKLFDELKDGIQEMRWASEEEARTQARELESLKADIRRLNAQKEESLESQRRDLTQTFENILQQREESFAGKEREIASQVTLLESRFESLQTENTRLKSEAAASLRKREALAEEVGSKEETRRQLQWALDDERAARAQAENLHAHQLQQLSLEISMLKENAGNDVTELKWKLAMAKEDADREKEFRTVLEQRAEELRRSAQQDLSTLEAEIAEARALVGRQQLQVASLRDERDTAQQRAAGFKVECDGLDLRLATVSADLEAASEELLTLRARLQQTEAQYAQLQQEYQDHRCRVRDQESSALQSVTAQLVEARAAHLQELSLLRRAHAEELARLAQQHEQALQQRSGELTQRQDGDMLQVQKRLADRESELAICRGSVETLTAELAEERKERAALKLRFSVHETQAQQYQQQIKALQKQLRHEDGGGAGSNALSARPGVGAAPHLQIPEQPESPDGSLRESGEYLHSPMFSEDLGFMSLPGSPMTSMVRRPQGGGYSSGDFGSREATQQQQQQQQQEYYHKRAPQSGQQREAFDVWGESKAGAGEHLQQPAVTRLVEDQALLEENARLKKLVKEMRHEVEQLHCELEVNRSVSHSPTKASAEAQDDDQAPQGGDQPLQRSSNSVSASSGASVRSSMDVADREKFGLLETRLQQTMEEVRRLRQERYSVMDAGNKLRSALTKHALHPDAPPDEAAATELLSEVDHVQQWLEAAVPRSSHDAGAAPYEFSEEFEDYYRGSTHAQRNSERYRQEQRELELQRQQRAEEDRRRRARSGEGVGRGGRSSTSAGMSTAALLGEESDGWGSASERKRAGDGRANYSYPSEEEEYSAGRRVWGSPGRRGDGASRIPTAAAGSRSAAVSSGSSARAKQLHGPQSTGRGKASSGTGSLPMKHSAREDMQLQGQSIGGATLQSQPQKQALHLSHTAASQTSPHFPTDEALGFSPTAVSAAAQGNLLASAGTALPRANSSRMTPSQVEALRKIQDAKKRHSMHVGVVPTSAGSTAAASAVSSSAPTITVGNRKITNYSKWMEHPTT